ncbi:MFS transporter [Kitasatospora acidiphila]|uniref:MFS transporter n=1 Tax=Kitasatospora acidiphila TaxID=2567942 RepID=A0A540W6Q3_9ACTN|nr:MFS transporter [Kitasatospora acidiphila]TQF04705.1 MFS transporter [Kitasatospora acidiphila]
MFSSYRQVLTPTGALAFTLTGLLGRLGYAMQGVSLLTAIAVRRHSYALAGTVTAAAMVGVAIGLPLLGRLVDRYGQRRIALPAALLTLAPQLALVLLIHRQAPTWALAATAFASSFGPNLGGMARARWAHLHQDDPTVLHRANALEQALDELCFMTGPVLGAVLCTWQPEAGLLAIAVLTTVGGVLFAAERRTEPPIAPVTAGDGVRPRAHGVPALLAVFFGTGILFGSLEITTLAWTGAHGHSWAAGPLLGLQAAGSCAAGLAFGMLPARGGAVRRLLLGLTAMAALLLLPLGAVGLGGGVALLAPAMLLAGSGTAPTMVSGFTLLQRLLPTGALNAGMAVAVAAIITGSSAGSVLGGLLIQHTAPGAGFVLPAVAAATALLIAHTARHRLRRATVQPTDPAHAAG